MTNTYQIDTVEYKHFCGKYHAGDFGSQRYGQAFYNHFKLDKINNKDLGNLLWEAAEVTAKDLIVRHFEFN